VFLPPNPGDGIPDLLVRDQIIPDFRVEGQSEWQWVKSVRNDKKRVKNSKQRSA